MCPRTLLETAATGTAAADRDKGEWVKDVCASLGPAAAAAWKKLSQECHLTC